MVSEVVSSALSVLNQWQYVQYKSFDHTPGFLTPKDGRVSWQALTQGRVKVNTDAALFENLNKYSYAQIVRDHNGDLVEAMSRCLQGTVSPELAEALRIKEAISWVEKKQQTNVVIETDCLVLVQWIRSSYNSFSYVRRLVNECRQLLLCLQSKNVMLRFVK